MQEITPSRMAMFEGMIALAWVDAPIHDANRARLVQMFGENVYLSDAQRAALMAQIDAPGDMPEIWPRITELQDRAHLLDYAERIFWADGEYSDEERALYQQFFAQHLATINAGGVKDVLKAYAVELREKRRKHPKQVIKNGIGAGWSFWDSQV